MWLPYLKFSDLLAETHLLFFWPYALFVLILHIPVNNCSDMSGPIFLGWTSIKQWIKCLSQGHNTVSLVRLKPAKPQSWVKHSTNEPPHSLAGPRSAVGNVSGYRCVSDCRARGREFDPGPAPYFRGDWSWNYLYGHSPPFRWFIQEGLLSVTSESMCTNYWLTACSSLPRKKCG